MITKKEEVTKRKTLQEITNACTIDHDGNLTDSRMCVIDSEMRQGYDLISKYPRSVTVFGSARITEENAIFSKVENLSKKIADLDYAVVTGGGHGLMGAANKGAHASDKGASVGINISLPFEQTVNEHLVDSIEFHHFFTRKVALAYSAEVYIFCPGGFGTMDEFFEILTLKQTRKIPNIPIILYDTKFWAPLIEYFENTLLQKGQETISREDLALYTVTDDDNEVLEIIKNAPIRTDISSTHEIGH